MDRPTDECLNNQQIRALHHRIAKEGFHSMLNDLAEREPALAAYVLYCGHIASDAAQQQQMPAHFTTWLNETVVRSLLVVIEAQRQAHYALWRDLMGDDPESTTPNEPKGD